nr:MAG TPA: hypothetical protein [Caudoviricetes sp.]DAX89679.1 MAG TPA: hypothetical protein [Caudoviricetes sp.]
MLLYRIYVRLSRLYVELLQFIYHDFSILLLLCMVLSYL